MSLLPRFTFTRDLFDNDFGFSNIFQMIPADSCTDDQSRSWLPQLDLSETDTGYSVSCELPGLSKESARIDIDEENRRLTISGSHEEVKKEEGERFHLVERRYGDFKRSIALPKDVNVDEIKAKMEDGVLHVALPKLEKPLAKEKRSLTIE